MRQNSIKIANEEDLKREIVKALKFYEAFHWGIQSDKQGYEKHILLDENDVLCEIGKLRAVVYETRKGEDMKASEFWFHSFNVPFPVLSTTSIGKGLFISGGKFKIEENGIIN